ncbi:transcriptional regulator [Odoribacter sp. OF09-27XD]|nr:phage regulatory protein/antirepressor Ant [Odoribacter sp. OF09-27XD]RHV92577.1 transcriptional regulator [Odoribacter sp. OF09-27XD]
MLNKENELQLTVQGTVAVARIIHETDYITSLQVSEITGREHKNVMRDIRNLLNQLENRNGFSFELVNYVDQKGELRPCYNLTKKDSLLLASGYDANLRAKIINRWEELERQKQTGGFQVPQTFADALLLAAQQQKQLESLAEQNKLQSQQLEEDAPKVEYYEKALKSESVYNTTQIAKEFGWGAVTLNRKLQQLGIQYLCNGQWVLYSRYQNKGYTKTNSYPYGYHEDGTIRTRALTVWTEKGRKFLHDLFD